DSVRSATRDADTHPTGSIADRLMRAARELFYHHGIRPVSVDQIIARAGIAKPSLYRLYPSKERLAIAYLEDDIRAFWRGFDAAAALHPHDPRAQILAVLAALTRKAANPGYRGCALTNAAIEYPGADQAIRLVATAHKQALRTRLIALSRAMGAGKSEALANGLLLLIEGAYATGQLFDHDKPIVALLETAAQLIDAALSAVDAGRIADAAAVAK
ncbi:MAG TPA: TetR/AcrR family transcriptional regulator, partial [Dongiaceae bacterium]